MLCRVQSGARSALRCPGSARCPARCTPLPAVAHTCVMAGTATCRGTSCTYGRQTSSCMTSSLATKPLAPVTTATSIIVATSRLDQSSNGRPPLRPSGITTKARHEASLAARAVAALHLIFDPSSTARPHPAVKVFASAAPQHAGLAACTRLNTPLHS